MFLKHKRDDRIKGRLVSGGNKQHEYVDKHDISSPTTSTESLFLLITMFASENRTIVTDDIPNSFPQTDIPKDKGDIYIKVKGDLEKKVN